MAAIVELTSDEIVLSGQTSPAVALRAPVPGGRFRIVNPAGATVMFCVDCSAFPAGGEAQLKLMIVARSLRGPVASAFVKTAGPSLLFVASGFPAPAYEIDALGTAGIKLRVTAFVGSGVPSLLVGSGVVHYTPSLWASAPTEVFSPSQFIDKTAGTIGSSWATQLVTPSDTDDLAAGPAEGLLVGTTGAYKITTADGVGTATVTLAAGVVHPIAARRVWATPAPAGSVWACYNRRAS